MQRRVVLVLGLLLGVLLTNLFYSTLTTYTTSSTTSTTPTSDPFQPTQVLARRDRENVIEQLKERSGNQEWEEAEKKGEDCTSIEELKKQMQQLEKQIEAMTEDVQSLKNSSRTATASTDEKGATQKDKKLEQRWLSSMLRIRDTFAGKKGISYNDNSTKIRNFNDESRKISEDTELCVVWKFNLEIAIGEHYAFFHDFLLYYLDANVRLVPHYLAADGACACQNLLVVIPDKVGYSALEAFQGIAAVRENECRDSSIGIFVNTPMLMDFLPVIHKKIVERGIELFDYVLFNTWHPTLDLDPEINNYLWIPLGHTSGVPPATFPQLVPSSKRRHFCSWHGSVWERTRQDASEGMAKFFGQKESTVNCSTGIGLAPIMFRAMLLETVVAVTPPNEDSSETSRVWEALDAGAIPLMLASQPWAALPSDHPLLVANNLEEYWNMFQHLRTMPDKELDELQGRTIRWWIRYRQQVQFKVADLIESHLQKDPAPTLPPKPTPLSRFTNVSKDTITHVSVWRMKHQWLSSLKKARNGVLTPRPELCVIWTVYPPKTWEFLYVQDHLLAYVDANVRFCDSKHLADCCCRHSVIVVNFVRGYTVDFPRLYNWLRNDCSLSVGLIIHAAESTSGLSYIVKNETLQYDYVLHNYWFEELDPLRPHVTWVPLGFSDDTRPASPSHIIPASRRKLFCSFRGGFSHPIRQQIADDLVNHTTLNCSISFAKLSHKLFFRQELLDTVVSLCPSGASRDTFRLWESLDAGAIPILMRDRTFSELPKDHPLIMVGDVEDFRNVLYELKALTPEQLDAYQLRVARWWFDYRLKIQLTVTSTIDAAIYSSEGISLDTS